MKYEFKVKKIDVTAGGKNVVVLNKEDAEDIDVGIMDRVKVKTNGKEAVAIVDLTEKYIKKGQIGCFSDLVKRLGLKNNQKVRIEPIEKPETVEYIKKKLDGIELSKEEINAIIRDVMRETLSDVELTALVSAMYIRGLTDKETIGLTKAIINSGATLEFKKRPILDKHCVGGVPGNRTTMIIVPIVAAAGLTIPKTSSRSITSAAGTADTMEVLAPVSLSVEKIKEVVEKTNGCMVWGGGVNLAAADDKLIKIRHPLNLDPKGVLLASILAKKKAVGATHVLIDIPIGLGAKVASKKEAQALAEDFMKIGSALGMEVNCIITPGYDPVGQAVGPALEAREVLKILKGEQVSPDLVEKSLVMSGLLLEMGGKVKKGQGRLLAEKILRKGEALQKMREIIEAQGGNPDIEPEDIKIGKKSLDIYSKETGRIFLVNVKKINSIARAAGAPKDKGAGVYLYVEKGDKVKKGQKLFTIYAESSRKLKAAQELVEKLKPIEFEKIILGEYSTERKPMVYEFH